MGQRTDTDAYGGADRSGLATNTRRVELYLTVSMYCGLGIQPLWVLSARAETGWGILLLALMSVLQTVGSIVMIRWSLRTRRRGGQFPRLPVRDLRLIGAWVFGSLVFAGTAIALSSPSLGVAMVLWAILVLTPLLTALTAFVLTNVLGVLVGTGIVLTMGVQSGVPLAGAALMLGYVLIGTFWLSAWTVRVLWDLETARGTAGRLAVAEERLRFARDLHDVFGRTLSAVAVKSELGAELARRGQSEKAAAQMTEVRQLADDAGREVRAVVGGYRRADLAHEVIGARSVLQSAGVQTTVAGDTEGLPAEASAALAWVTREAITNVLRHSDASRCTITIHRTTDRAELTVENDHPHEPDPGHRGSGVEGLRERLGPIGGHLETSHHADRYRVRASVPLTTAPAPEPTESPEPAERREARR